MTSPRRAARRARPTGITRRAHLRRHASVSHGCRPPSCRRSIGRSADHSLATIAPYARHAELSTAFNCGYSSSSASMLLPCASIPSSSPTQDARALDPRLAGTRQHRRRCAQGDGRRCRARRTSCFPAPTASNRSTTARCRDCSDTACEARCTRRSAIRRSRPPSRPGAA